MVEIQNNKEIEKYIKKYEIEKLFTDNTKKQMNLYLFNKNEYICREEEQLEYMFFLVKGKAKVSKHLENGKSLLISFYTPMTIIGDVEFIRNNPTDCSVQAIEDTYCIGIRLEIVRSVLINDCKFLLNICEYLSNKLTSNSNNSSINLLYPLENRLASYILAYINIDEQNNKFSFKESYNEISELLGTSYRHLNRTLNKFCSNEILIKSNEGYIIKDFEKLLNLAGDLYK